MSKSLVEDLSTIVKRLNICIELR